MPKTTNSIKTIPMLDLKAQHDPLNDEIKNAVREILDSSRFILGPNVSSFEQ